MAISLANKQRAGFLLAVVTMLLMGTRVTGSAPAGPVPKQEQPGIIGGVACGLVPGLGSALGVSCAEVTVSPNPVSFGDVAVGASSVRQVMVSSAGAGPVAIHSASVTGANGGDFSIIHDGCAGTTQDPGSSCLVAVQFRPASSGSRAASLVLQDGAPDSPQSIGLNGTGTAVPPAPAPNAVPAAAHAAPPAQPAPAKPKPAAAPAAPAAPAAKPPALPAVTIGPGSVDFGQANLGSSVSRTVTVMSSGGAAVAFQTATVTGPDAGDFTASHDQCSGASLAPGASCVVEIDFRPSTLGGRSATLMLNDAAAGSPQGLSLAGIGAGVPAITLGPASVDFGQATVGDMVMRRITVTSAGTAPLTIQSMSFTGPDAADFTTSVDVCSGTSLNPGTSCVLDVRFRPAGPGARSGSMVVKDAALDSPQELNLVGEGVSPIRSRVAEPDAVSLYVSVLVAFLLSAGVAGVVRRLWA